MKKLLVNAALIPFISLTPLSVASVQAADYNLTFAHVLIESTPNGKAAIQFKRS